MIRRQFTLSGLVAALAPQHRCWALGLRDLSDAEASKGLTTALETGALCAVGQLGRTDGFLANPAVRIPLPAQLDGAAKLLRTLGQGKQLDELVTTMNRAAESAVPMAKDMIVGAIKSMTVSDAKKILTGGETSATQFFAEKTRSALTLKFLPVITQSTQKLGLAACFLSRKELFVLDEPMSGLDPSARVHVKNLLQRLKNDGKSLVFTSHSLADIDEICDHMVVLHCGSVVYSGSPGMLLERQGEPSLERAFLKCIESNVHDR